MAHNFFIYSEADGHYKISPLNKSIYRGIMAFLYKGQVAYNTLIN